jgi:hypothetical protein
MKKQAIKKSKAIIEKEGEALMQMEDAAKLFYERRYFSAYTLVREAAQTLEKITEMKQYAGKEPLSMGMSIKPDKTKGRQRATPVPFENVHRIMAAQIIWLCMVMYYQVNDRYPAGKWFEKFRKDKNLGAYQTPFHSENEKRAYRAMRTVLTRPDNRKKAGNIDAIMPEV